DAVAGRLVTQHRVAGRRIGAERQLMRRKEVFGPLRACERPFALRPQYELFAGMADVERHARLPLPAAVLAFEKMADESLLQRLPVAAVEMSEVSVAVHLEPFLLRVGAQPAFEIAAWMQTHAAPIRRR